MLDRAEHGGILPSGRKLTTQTHHPVTLLRCPSYWWRYSYCIHASDQHQEVPALVRAEELEDLDNGIPEAAACPLTRLSQQHLELGKCLLDGIKGSSQNNRSIYGSR